MYPCPKCSSVATWPSSDKDWRDPLLRVFQFHAVRCYLCNHRFRVFAFPNEWKKKKDGIRKGKAMGAGTG